MPATKSARIALRAPPQIMVVIEQAAALAGVSTSEFILQSACAAAHQALAEANTLVLSARDFEAFVAAGENPPKPSDALRKLMARS
ncbi:MAG: DUF1778 domain-containing protein [Xanthomonadales bacterium]|nr:DUF1778 domain-containing protein [Xanthomonadales bacterium]MCB1610491.1 DUF1778 domain-containing protein [Xanthomonadales bacterium]